MEGEESLSLGGVELDLGEFDGLAVGGDAEGACVGCGVGEFAIKGEGDGAAVDLSGVDVEGLSGSFGAVFDGKVGDGGEVVAGEILDDVGCLVSVQIAVAEGDAAACIYWS